MHPFPISIMTNNVRWLYSPNLLTRLSNFRQPAKVAPCTQGSYFIRARLITLEPSDIGLPIARAPSS